MPGQNEEDDTDGAGVAKASQPTSYPEPTPLLTDTPVRSNATSGGLRGWFGRQTRSVRGSMFMIAMFAMINLLTNGFSEIWFVYPSIPFAFFLVVRSLGNRA